ncbi:hypothetical protein MNB_SV-15-300 [hydrothermal vent metagenome]|uniref:Uncharacterized protein n=1 Tax=hydrothermal vent metagenome TaxID=652676 RepID=A0A1W1EIM9_9ZZZZ
MKILLLFIYISISILYGNSIDDKIKALKNAPTKEKFKLMNAIKKEIASMHQKERFKAIKKLQKNMDNNQSTKKIISKDIKIKVENQAEKTISNTVDNYQFQGGEYD